MDVLKFGRDPGWTHRNSSWTLVCGKLGNSGLAHCGGLLYNPNMNASKYGEVFFFFVNKIYKINKFLIFKKEVLTFQ